MATRAALLVAGAVVIALLSLTMTGTIASGDNREALVFQGGFLLVVFGSLLLEDKFTKPADALVSSVGALVSLIPVYNPSTSLLWWIVVAYALIVLIAGIVNLVVATREQMEGIRLRISRVTYVVSTSLGKSNLIFSIVFLYAVFSFYGLQSEKTAVLVLFWGIYMTLWPLKIPHILQALFVKPQPVTEQGTIARVDEPDLIKVRLHTNGKWQGHLVARLADGRVRRVLPLYTQVQDAVVVGTGLLQDEINSVGLRLESGSVCKTEEAPPLADIPVGIIVEGTKLAKIHFATWKPNDFSEGILVYCQIDDETVYYQVSDAATREESFERHLYGFQVVEAHQLGTFSSADGFKKYEWLPNMNTPVYIAAQAVQAGNVQLQNSQMCLGKVPGTSIDVVCNVDDMISHHTAILGVTGSGKTELAYRLIRHAIGNDVKVFCVDITGQYSTHLNDLCPSELSISPQLADDLGEKLHEVETGAYGAGEQKKVLKTFADRLRTDIDAKVREFIDSPCPIGIFTMPSISNTKATIYATEIYLSSIFNYGRQNTPDKKRILVVVEEAHTVIPEASTMGLGDNESKGMVARIAQIALQGRKYNVGLLIVSQRTATVSKTVLTQCNTMVTFSSFDQTGLDFLSNIYGAEHSSKISNLPFLHALAYGKGIKSERPIVVEMPFDSGLGSR